MAPSLHSICWRALEKRVNVESLSNLGYALLPSFEVKIKGNIYVLSNKYFLSEALKQLCESAHNDIRQETKLFNTFNWLRNLLEEIVFLIWELLPLITVRCLISL